MALSEDDLEEADAKIRKYFKSNIDKTVTKDVKVYHQSCALEITGLKVTSGSKNFLNCATCKKVVCNSELNRACSLDPRSQN